MAQAGAKLTKVKALVIKPRSLTSYASFVGHLAPKERVPISSEVEGIIEKANFDLGQRVTEGQVLVRFETSKSALAHKLNRANYKLAFAEYKREKELYKQGLSAKSQVETLKTKMEVNRYQMELSRLDLAKSTVKSPIDGVVSKKKVEQGEYKARGKLLLELISMKWVKAEINLPERDIRFAKVGKEVMVSLDAIPGQTYEGVISMVSREANTQNRSFAIEVEISNPQFELLPGMLARVRMTTYDLSRQVVIPRYAVLQDEKGSYVYLVNKGHSLKRPVRLGISQGSEVQIKEGVAFEDHLIIVGQELIAHNEEIEVVQTRDQIAQQ